MHVRILSTLFASQSFCLQYSVSCLVVLLSRHVPLIEWKLPFQIFSIQVESAPSSSVEFPFSLSAMCYGRIPLRI